MKACSLLLLLEKVQALDENDIEKEKENITTLANYLFPNLCTSCGQKIEIKKLFNLIKQHKMGKITFSKDAPKGFVPFMEVNGKKQHVGRSNIHEITKADLDKYLKTKGSEFKNYFDVNDNPKDSKHKKSEPLNITPIETNKDSDGLKF